MCGLAPADVSWEIEVDDPVHRTGLPTDDSLISPRIVTPHFFTKLLTEVVTFLESQKPDIGAVYGTQRRVC